MPAQINLRSSSTPSASDLRFRLFDLGFARYNEAWQLQKKLLAEIHDGRLDSALILCNHYPVITLGRAAKKSNILISLEKLRSIGIELFEIERGGDVTYHGPGQLTVYPLLNLKIMKNDLHFYLRKLEYITIEALSEYGIAAESIPGLTGVWVNDKKIASIGLSVRRWVTYHGLSINVRKDDLNNFKYIRPCGLDVEMTSVESESGKTVNMDDLKRKITGIFARSFSCFNPAAKQIQGGIDD